MNDKPIPEWFKELLVTLRYMVHSLTGKRATELWIGHALTMPLFGRLPTQTEGARLFDLDVHISDHAWLIEVR